jgi:DNA-binding GntR family transcriptional regulator
MAQQIVTGKISERIASQLRDEIIAGTHTPGAPLRLMPLAERLGVSTTPVREALAILERQGLLTAQLHRGFRVAEISPRDIGDVYAVHAFISQLLTERAARRLSDEDIDELDDLDEGVRQATKDADAELAADLNYELHRRIHLAGDSPLLVRFLRETTPFVSRRHDPDVPGWAQQRIEGHGSILQALRRREGAMAAELMGAHIRRSGDLAARFAEEQRGNANQAAGTVVRSSDGHGSRSMSGASSRARSTSSRVT